MATVHRARRPHRVSAKDFWHSTLPPPGPHDLVVGLDPDTGAPIWETPRELSMHNVHVGSTGGGKSTHGRFILEQLCHPQRAFGFLLLDPHGGFAKRTATTLFRRGISDRVLLCDFSRADPIVAFNPLQLNGRTPHYISQHMASATCVGMGEYDPFKTPTVTATLRAIYHVLAEHQLSLTVARHLVNPCETTLKRTLATASSNFFAQVQLQMLSELSTVHQRFDELGSSFRRLGNLLGDDHLTLAFGQQENVLPFRRLMDEGWIVIVSLGTDGIISGETAQVVGNLLINDLFTTAMQRPEGARPFLLVIDEAADYISPDTAKILAQCRKKGLYLDLYLQGLYQAREASPYAYHAIMNEARNKFFMGIDDQEDALLCAANAYTPYVKLMETKDERYGTRFRPVEKTRTIYGLSGGAGSGATITTGFSVDPDGNLTQTGNAATALQQMDGWSEVTVPWIEHEEFQELISREKWTYQEQIFRAAQGIMSKLPGQGVVKPVFRAPLDYVVPHDPYEPMPDEDYEAAWATHVAQQPFTLSAPEARRRLEAKEHRDLTFLTERARLPAPERPRVRKLRF